MSSENNALNHLQNVSFVKGAPEFEKPENVPTLIDLDDLVDSAYSAKVSELFIKGSNQRTITVNLITRNLFHQGPSSRDISLNSKYYVVFNNTGEITEILQLARNI